MKNLFFSLGILALVAVTSNGFGQATSPDDTQSPGSTHQFSISDNSGGGFTYAWGVYSDELLTTAITSGFTLTNGTTAKATIEWTTIPVGDYYVGVTESNPKGCSTKRYVKIAIATANYDLVVTPVAADGTTVLTDLDECMEGAGQILDNYKALLRPDTERYFKVKLTEDGSTPWTSGTWKFDYILTGLDQQGTPAETITKVEVVGTPAGVTGVSGTAAATATTVSVSNVGELVLKVTTKANPGMATTYDVNLVLTASNLKVGAAELAEDAAGTGANTQTYILRTYPATTTITIN